MGVGCSHRALLGDAKTRPAPQVYPVWTPVGRRAGYVKLGRPTSLSRGSVHGGAWGVGPPRAGRRVPGRPPAPPGLLPAAPRTSDRGGRGQGVCEPVPRSANAAPACACAQGREGGGDQEAAPGAGTASRGEADSPWGTAGPRSWRPRPRRGPRARLLSAGRRGGGGPRTHGPEGPAAARARRSRALSRRGRVAGRRCERPRRAGGRAAGGAVRPGPGRTAGRSAAAIGPRCRPPPPPIGRRAAPLLRHRPAGGAPSGTRGKVQRNLRVRGGGAPGNPSRRGDGSGRLVPPAAVPPLGESLGSHVDAPGPSTVTFLVTLRVVFQVPFALTLCDLGRYRLYLEASRGRNCDS